MAATVLVVEDERKLRDFIRTYLERAGFTVLSTGSGAEAITLAADAAPDLVVLDLGLPDVPGETVARELREMSPIPILILTAKAAEEDRIRGLELGADDYVTKPFSPRELVARVKTVLRRTRGVERSTPLLQAGRVSLDPDRRRAYVDSTEVVLTTTEFDLLACLMRRPGRVFSREQLLSEVWGYSSIAGARTVDVHVAQVRGKLGEASPIRTVRGVGYAAEQSRE